MPPRVSIVIVALNEAGNLARTLQAIREMDSPAGDCEVVVVDGGSSDSTAEVARNAGARVVVAPGKNIPASRNIGVANASAPVVAFVDADCLVRRDWLRQGLKHFEAGNDVMAGSPALPPQSGTWVQRCWADHYRVKASAAGQGGVADDVGLLTTRNLFVSRRIIDAVGGFDEKLNTGEDYYFCYKVREAGFRLVCDHDISVVHIGEPAALRDFFQEQMWHFSNALTFRFLMKGKRRGLNAVLFGLYMLAGLLCAGAGVVMGLLGRGWFPALFGAALFASGPLLLAVRTVLKRGRWSRLPGYFVLYLAYGLARVVTFWPGFWLLRKSPKAASTS